MKSNQGSMQIENSVKSPSMEKEGQSKDLEEEIKTVNFKAEKVLVARISGFTGDEIAALELKDKKCVFLVSVGKQNFERDALVAQLRLLQKDFGEVLILAADSLQRFNFLSTNLCDRHFMPESVEIISENMAEKKSIVCGETWVENCQLILEALFTGQHSFKISQWDDWKSNFNEAKKNIEAFRANFPEYEKALESSINQYLKRFVKHYIEKQPLEKRIELEEIMKTEVIRNAIKNNCRDYLIEECAVLQTLANAGYDYIVYPGKPTSILNETLQSIQQVKGSLNWITLRLDKKYPTVMNASSFWRNGQREVKSVFPTVVDVSSAIDCIKKTINCIKQLPPEAQMVFFNGLLNLAVAEAEIFDIPKRKH